MSDEAAPLNEDTPEAPVADTPEGTDWQKRYSDLQPEYTRATQALKDAESVWEDEEAVKARLLEKFGWNLQDDDTDDDLDDDDEPVAVKDPRVDEHDQFIAEQRAEKALERFNKDLKAEAGEDRELPQQGKDWIYNETIRLGDGRENLKKAVKAWTEFEDSLGKQYLAQLKKSKKAPHVPAGGEPATGTKSTADMTRQELDRHMVERAEALAAQ